MRRIIALVLIFSVGMTVAGTYLSRSPQTESLGNCSAQDLIAVQQSISNQTQFLSAQDFGQAMSYASDSFRSRISENQFARIISIGYEFLLQNPAISFDSCNQDSGNRIVISASFDSGAEVMQLKYFMIKERNGWFIDSAGRSGDETLTI